MKNQKPISRSFENPKEEIEYYLEIWRKEREEEEREFVYSKVSGFQISSYRNRGGRDISITLEKKNIEKNLKDYQKGSPIAILGTALKLRGVISKIEKDSITVFCRTKEEIEEFTGLSIQRVFSNVGEEDILKSATNLLENTKRLHQLLGYKEFALSVIREQALEFEQGTPSQKECMQKILYHEDFVAIWGPPGTGKTTLIIESVRELLKQNKKVLLVASSNFACDVLVEKTREITNSITRLGSSSRISEEVLEYSLEEKWENSDENKLSQNAIQDLRKVQAKIANLYSKPFSKREGLAELKQERKFLESMISKTEEVYTKYILESSNVIIGTPASTRILFRLGLKFDCLFFDEATQTNLLESLIPIPLATKLILIGDPKQLGPYSKEIPSLLEKTLENQNILATRSGNLLEQFRMEDEIATFSNKTFYENKLENRKKKSQAQTSSLFTSKIVWIDTSSTDAEEFFDGESYQNELEIQVVGNLLETLELELTDTKSEITVLTPYSSQRLLLEERIFPKAKVFTVDGFQGRESEIIILSLVRTEKIGFLEEARRLNVALTRAKDLLVIVGNSECFSESILFQKLLKTIEEKGEVVSAWSFIY